MSSALCIWNSSKFDRVCVSNLSCDGTISCGVAHCSRKSGALVILRARLPTQIDWFHVFFWRSLFDDLRVFSLSLILAGVIGEWTIRVIHLPLKLLLILSLVNFLLYRCGDDGRIFPCIIELNRLTASKVPLKVARRADLAFIYRRRYYFLLVLWLYFTHQCFVFFVIFSKCTRWMKPLARTMESSTASTHYTSGTTCLLWSPELPPSINVLYIGFSCSIYARKHDFFSHACSQPILRKFL